jgi:glucose-1-phosphate cytidylyltransferase
MRMKTLILAGGYGSRLGTIGESLPKPLLSIGGRPILWHIMKIYSHYGFNDFVVLLGHQGHKIKEYFFHYHMLNRDFTVDLANDRVIYLGGASAEPWTVTLLDTGVDTLKGGRIKMAEAQLDDGVHMLTYGDGVADVDLPALLRFHRSHGRMLTLTGVRPPSRFGELLVEENRVTSFVEKPQVSAGLINGGFMVFNRDLLQHLRADRDCDFEFGILEELARRGEVMVYEHSGFWACVDTERDLNHLNRLWRENRAQWNVWRR